MASLLNNASLLLNPAGSIISYQEDKIYSVLPKDGTGDFTFSGGDGGTRVNQQGYIEQTPANFMLNSVTTWNPSNVTVTTGVTDPVGGTGAYTIGSIASGNITDYAYKLSNAISLPAGTTFTYSIYMKGSGTIATYVERSVSGGYFFDVKTHTLSSEWQVFTHSYTVSSDANGVGVYVGNATGTTATSVDIAFPMLNYGSTAKPYQPTTDRLNYPRITYQNGRGALLSELQRTNLALYGNTFPSVNYPSNVNGYYYYSAATLNSTNNLSPDGTNNAYNITMHNVVYDMYSTFTGLSVGTTYSYSVYVKLGSATNFAVVVNNTVAWNSVAGSQTFTNLNGTNYTRVSITFVAPVQGQVNIHLGGHAENITQQSPGDVYIWGEQFEPGEFASTYIPTTSATVTRPKDYIQKNNITLAPTEATYYADFTLTNGPVGGYNTVFLHYKATAPAQYNYVTINGGNILGITTYNGTTQANINGGAITIGKWYKIAYRAKTNDFALFINGIKVGSDTSGTYPDFTSVLPNLYVGNDPSNEQLGQNNTFALFETAYSDAQCQELTTVRSGSGGNISYYGPYTIHTFTGSATFTPSFTGPVEVLVAAGGGAGGGGDVGGGGGAGGLLYVSSYGVSQSTGITVTIGAGGAGVQNASLAGGNGSNSVFGGLTAIGGGGGAGWTKGTGNDGGSGGGSTYYGVGGKGIPGQGNDGGTGGVLGPPYPQCGGGGAGQIGLPATGSTIAGNGGAGLPYSISGFSTYYAGGGGGATEGDANVPGTPGTGGLGGGGNGGSQGAGTLGKNGVDGLGGGGGGCDPQAGATGGSGIVIVRYLT